LKYAAHTRQENMMHPKEEEQLPDESQIEEPTEYAEEPAINGLDSKVASGDDTDEFGADDDG
jgi:hypothetical protein